MSCADGRPPVPDRLSPDSRLLGVDGEVRVSDAAVGALRRFRDLNDS